jgi:signal transduction histidine kinase
MQRVGRTGGQEERDGDEGVVVRLVAPEDGASEDDLRAIRTRVLNVVGHELRTPVTTLRGLADALTAVDAGTARDHVIPAIQRSTVRLERLVNDLLVANGIATALPVGKPKAIELVSALHAVWGDLGGEAHELTVEVTASGSRSPIALTHPEALRGALERVLENARVLGDEPPTVRVDRDGTTLTIEVDSPGQELGAEEVRLATELLFRGHAAVMRTAGLGLGLPVARALLEHTGGTLAVRAREGGGLVTVITVPGSDG